MIDENEFRRVMGHFPTGVSVVTTLARGGRPCGLTVNAFCSVSVEPTLVLVCVERGSDSHECIGGSGFFAVSVLEGEHGESLARRFSDAEAGDKFDGVAHRSERTGAPVLEAAMAWLDCTVVQEVRAGDHTVFIAEVVAADARTGEPLIYFRGGYGALSH